MDVVKMTMQDNIQQMLANEERLDQISQNAENLNEQVGALGHDISEHNKYTVITLQTLRCVESDFAHLLRNTTIFQGNKVNFGLFVCPKTLTTNLSRKSRKKSAQPQYIRRRE